ncbi:hypothetical protein ACF09C_34490 [Streptomyces sp. NPDC014870]|uniref:hypothetical protein n=1 Tax=Streptomyces sp. NPDC014870 TaxID=3364925 RepID=UPI0036F7483C
MAETKPDRLQRLWDESRVMPFPPGFTQREPEGVCMAMVDTMLSGCVVSALTGPLDDWRRGVLLARIEVLGKTLPSIADDEYATKYFALLYESAVLAAELDAART